MTKEEFISKIAIKLYLKESHRRRRKFLNWELKDSWDAENIFTSCISEAEFLYDELVKNKLI